MSGACAHGRSDDEERVMRAMRSANRLVISVWRLDLESPGPGASFGDLARVDHRLSVHQHE